MSEVIKTKEESEAQAALSKLSFALRNMGLTEGQVSRLAALIAAYGLAERAAGHSRERFSGGDAA